MTYSALPYTKDIDIGTNELITRMSVNRNIGKLVENDRALARMYTESLDGLDISKYASGRTYNYGDLVWFDPRRGDGTERFLLKCLLDENQNDPSNALDPAEPLVGGNPNFEKFGWKNENQLINLSADDVGIYQLLSKSVDTAYFEHETDGEEHRFGRISLDEKDPDYIDGKILRNDFSNLDENRDNMFFPYVTGHFETESVLDGVYRIWDNGLLEMNIVFRLGFAGTTREKDYDVVRLSCNNLQLRPSVAQYDTMLDYNSNMDYFYSSEDMSIFNRQGSGQSRIDSTLQGNRNDYVNVYSAEIDFSKAGMSFGGETINGFIDRNYMIFCADTLAQTNRYRDRKMVPCSNAMTFCNRSRKAVTALYITVPENGGLYDGNGYNAQNGGIAANSFSCQIVGRWKK